MTGRGTVVDSDGQLLLTKCGAQRQQLATFELHWQYTWSNEQAKKFAKSRVWG